MRHAHIPNSSSPASRSVFKNQAGGCTVDKQAPLAVCDPPLRSTDPATSAEHHTFCLDRASLRRNRPDEGNFEFKGRGADTLVQRRLDREAHATIEHCRRETAMHGAGGIQVDLARHRGNDDASVLRLDDVVSQGLGYRVERQCPVRQALDKIQAAHLLLPVGADGPISPAGDSVWHRVIPEKIEDDEMPRFSPPLYPRIAF
jgi:hypothetical protein